MSIFLSFRKPPDKCPVIARTEDMNHLTFANIRWVPLVVQLTLVTEREGEGKERHICTYVCMYMYENIHIYIR